MPTAPSDQRFGPRPGPAVAPGSRRPLLASDGTRYLLTTAVTVVLAAAYGAAVQTVAPDDIGSLGFVVSVYFGAWSVWAALYAGLTITVLRRADGAALAGWLTENRSGRRRRRRVEWLAGSGGPLGALSFCAVAIGAVVGAMVLRELREDPVVVGLAVLVVTTSWLLIVTVYVVHYARENARVGGLDFAGTGDGPPGFTDHEVQGHVTGGHPSLVDVHLLHGPRLERCGVADPAGPEFQPLGAPPHRQIRHQRAPRRGLRDIYAVRGGDRDPPRAGRDHRCGAAAAELPDRALDNP